jgi:uncharacterized protein YbjQ (UPF0145 family)
MNEEYLLLTVEYLDEYRVEFYHDIVTAHVSCGINFMRGWFVALRDFFGGTVGTYERESLRLEERAKAKLIEKAKRIPGANAIIGIRLNYHHVGSGGKSMLVLTATGTACRVRMAGQ